MDTKQLALLTAKSVQSFVVRKINELVDDKFKNLILPKDGKDGKDGRDGLDALDIDILPEIYPEKTYSYGTFACHKGGLWKAITKTRGMVGWECIVDGIGDINIEFDGERNIDLKITKSSDEVITKKIKFPVPIYRKVWKEGEYEKGDVVTYAGSQWTCIEDKTNKRPGEASSGWQLSVKAGRNGTSTVKINEDKKKTVKVGVSS